MLESYYSEHLLIDIGIKKTMRKMICIVITAAILLSGCATIIRGTEQSVHVNTNPIGAKIDFSNGQSCLSPCSITTKRDQSLIITVTKEGCHTQTATMVPSLAGGGAILGGFIDYGTGAVYDLQPNPLTLTLACTDAVANESNKQNQEKTFLVNEIKKSSNN